MISAQAQEEFFDAPDFKQIERNTKEPASSFYYPNLMKKYMEGDTKLTLNEGRHLYFGYVFQQGYEPTDTSSYNNLLAQTLAKGVFTPADYNDILQYSSALLLEDPFNLRALNAMLLVYAQQNDTEEYKRLAQKRKVVQDAIVSTGDGMSDNTPFYVIKVAHEYDILPFLGYSFGGNDKILSTKKINYLTLSENRFGVEKVYFNIAPVIDHVSSHGGGKM
jgi:hypothetical protein